MRQAAAGFIPPLPITNLVARFDATQGVAATAGVITQWNDISGNGNNATEATKGPLVRADYLGNPIVRFNGNHQLTFAGAQVFDARNTAVFAVGRMYGGTLFGIVGYAGGAGNLRNPGNPNNKWFAVTQNMLLQPIVNPMLLGSATASGNTTGVTNYRTAPTGSPVNSGSGTGGATLGMFNAGAFGVLDLAEVAVYTTPPSLAAVQAYFNTKYRLRSTPYAKAVTFEGDSITAGFGLAESMLSFPDQIMRASVADWQMINLGSSGATVTTLTSRATTTDSMITAGARNVLAVLIGRNDAAVGGVTAAQVYTSIQTYVQARVTAGWEVWVGTCIGTGSAVQAVLDPLNQLLRGTPLGGTGPGIIADAGATKVIDYGAQTHFITSADAANTTYYQADSTHPTVTGAALLATYAASVLAAA